MRRCEREGFLQGVNPFLKNFGFLVPCILYLLYVKFKSQTTEVVVWFGLCFFWIENSFVHSGVPC